MLLPAPRLRAWLPASPPTHLGAAASKLMRLMSSLMRSVPASRLNLPAAPQLLEGGGALIIGNCSGTELSWAPQEPPCPDQLPACARWGGYGASMEERGV